MSAYLNIICWSILCFVTCWLIKERYVDDYTHRKKKSKPTNQLVLTYNIQRLPWSLKPICFLRPLIRSHSIVLLQECFSNVLYDDIQHTFHEYHIVKGVMTGVTLVNSGLVILSKYPILSHTFVPFDVQDYLSTDALSEKGFLVAEIRVKQTTFFIINTHLQASFQRNSPHVVSSKQLQQLMAYVETLAHPFVIGGDFNMDHGEIPISLKRALTIFAPSQPTIYIQYDSEGTELNTSCKPAPYHQSFCYDYFLSHQMMLSPPQVMTFDYSDHAPVRTSLLL